MPTEHACADTSEIKGSTSSTTISYDYLVYAVGAEVQTFNIPGVQEHACFMKELGDAERVGDIIGVIFFSSNLHLLFVDAKTIHGL